MISSTGVIRASTAPGAGPPFSCSLPRLRSIVASPRSTAPGNVSWSEDGAPRGGHDLRDAGAHLARADDEDALENHGPSLPRATSSARRCRSRRTEYARTSARITRPTTTLIPLPRGSSLVASSVPGSLSRHDSVVSSAPFRCREHAERLVVEDRLVVGVDEALRGAHLDLAADRPLDVLVDQEPVDVPARGGPLGRHAPDERGVDVVEPLVEGNVRAGERKRARREDQRSENPGEDDAEQIRPRGGRRRPDRRPSRSPRDRARPRRAATRGRACRRYVRRRRRSDARARRRRR